MANILAVDDEQAILIMIQKILNKDGHNVTIVSEPKVVSQLRPESYDLILLDVMMPEIDGFTLCKEIRSYVDCPILFLTAKTEENSLVLGLELGGDDYISKPFGNLELRARVSAHLRREHREHFAKLTFANAYFNLSGKQLIVNEKVVPLTKGEYQICEFLAHHAGQIFSREQVYEGVFGYDGESSDNTISTHIKNIRSKLENMGYFPIKTVWGVGYKWEK
ncbi:response regulator transcription factor [Anaeromicropila populeti]|uniref:Stage 0 sporulation protein A homolog n=1 Tax=Anaeromicropila populeti TaxID=37658 RepID=A0A1I6KCG9_9FIRM|nr:response regulator transcription factor [Anaeromicropila populeti]SFR88728.1 DNA-binding response regulator, OmpR family, contains REC and winged-helix (wHTH) domain [Anaeromicropila populeti]